MSTPPVPIMQQPQQQPQQPPNPMQGLMQQAQTSMQNPASSGVPQPGAIGGLENHPIVKMIGQALAKAMQNIGFAGAAPQQRLEGQEMENQKAQAMARIAQEQQGLQQGQQRIGIEQQRTNQEGAYQTGQLSNEQKRTAQEGTYQTGMLGQGAERNRIEGQRANQEYETKKQQLDQEAKKIAAEYGPGGLREREVGNESMNARSNASRASTDAKLAQIADAREQLEAQYKQAEAQRAGLSTDRATLEDERKSRIAALGEVYGKSPWYETRATTAQRMQEGIKKINDDINGRIAQAEKAAGTGMAMGTGAPMAPTNKLQAKQAQMAPQAGAQQTPSGGIQIIRDATGRISGIK